MSDQRKAPTEAVKHPLALFLTQIVFTELFFRKEDL